MKTELATFANGCFWCTEAVFKRVKGVISVTSGFTGGTKENPSYEQVVMGITGGHAEAIQLTFDSNKISYDTLLDIFFATHDPTSLNRQGWDVGQMYRSAIFYHDKSQKAQAEQKIEALNKSGKYSSPIVTVIEPFNAFYSAEDYHQNFYESGNRPDYCHIIIDPKIQKLLKEFSSDVKDEYKT